MRSLVFVPGEFYHIYNRGVDKRKIYLRYGHYQRFLLTASNLLLFGSAQRQSVSSQSLALNMKVEVLAYCLMPNHYHLLVRQVEDGGISQFMHALNTSYTKYINLNLKRTGRLLESTFHAVHIQTDDQLIHVSRYIHLNPIIASIAQDITEYPWSSCFDYIGRRYSQLLPVSLFYILGHFKKNEEYAAYESFLRDRLETARKIMKQSEYLQDEIVDLF